MTDTELLISCPFCRSEKTREIPELYKVGYRVELPDDAAIEVRYRVYRCEECGREFDEEDAEKQ